MKYFIGCYFCLSLFLYGCGKDKNQLENYQIKTFSHEEIPEPILLRGVKHEFSELLFPRHILFVDGYIVISETRSDKMIHIINAKNREYVNSLGKNGMGPGEISVISSIQTGVHKGDFWVYDGALKTFSQFNINQKEKLAIEQFKQPQSFYLAIDMVWSSDTTLITELADGNEKFVEYSREGVRLGHYGLWSDMTERKVPYNVISSVHQGTIVASPDRNKFVKAGTVRDYLEILDKDKGTVISVRGPENLIPEFEVDYSAGYPMAFLTDINRKNFYLSVVPTRNYIYTLYLGENRDVVRNGEMAKTVLVFDYEGELQRSFKLDRSILSLAVDEEEKKFYGLTYDEDPNIIAFDFGE